MIEGLIVDLFAGGGGASAGIEAALGRHVDIGINHDPIALAVHKANHPRTHHLEADIWEVKPEEATQGRPVAILWASPDCTHFSVAKGGKPRQKKIRSLAWAVVRWAKAVKPAVIFLENVTEFKGWGPLRRDGKPDKRFMGQTFRKWKRQLERLGYEVDYRTLDASLYGAPTRRRRLFLIARRDGQPIRWPDVTHGPGKLPLRTAAECIDWSLECPSIFERKKPLAEKTLWRIAQGIKRFVIEAAQPFIVKVNHGIDAKSGRREHSIHQPLTTVTAKGNGHALVTPYIAGVGGRAAQSAPTGMEDPVGTITAKNDRVVVAPVIAPMNADNPPMSVERPLGTVTSQHNRFALTAAHLVKFRGDAHGSGMDAPVPTITAGPKENPAGAPHALGIVAHTLVQTGYGEREGQAARVPGIEKPLGTVVAGGQKHGLVSAFLAKHYGDRGQRPGVAADEPLATITASDHHALTAAHLVKLRGECHAAPMDEPMPTLTAGGFHVGDVRAFLTAYYGNGYEEGRGQAIEEPLRALRTKQHMGLVTVEGVDYQIVDIGMRMLEPHELLRAQFGRFAPAYDLSPARTKTAKVRLIGNSVCPEVAEAIVRENVPVSAARAA
jgi:DNA (cytosine-5)-methyltransferase 1